MTTPPVLKSHFRKLMESFKAAAEAKMCPEYSDHHERSTNYRYYR